MLLGGDREIQVVHGAFDDWNSLRECGFVHRVTFLEEWCAIDDQVDLPHQFSGIRIRDVRLDGYDLQVRVELAKSTSSALDTGLADPVIGHEELPIQIIGPEIASMGKNQSPDSGRGKFIGHCRAQAPHP
jgi:hypothetical protein